MSLAPEASFKNDTNYNNLSSNLANNYTNNTDLATTYATKSDISNNYQQKSSLETDVTSAGFVKNADITSAIAGLQNATDVQNAINSSLVGYELSANLDSDVAGLGFLKSDGLTGYVQSSNLDSSVSGLGYVKTGDVVAPTNYNSLKSALKPLVQALADSVNLLDADGNAFNFAPLLAQLV